MAYSKLPSDGSTGDRHPPSYDERCLTDMENEIRIVLVGRTGSGISSSGNSILKQNCFLSTSSGSSITKRCGFGTTMRYEKTVKVVDTPGLFGNSMALEDIRHEILNCFSLIKPGPHAILYILRIGRFTDEEIQGVRRFLEIFGGNPLQYTIIVLTGVDDLEWNQSSTVEYLNNAPISLKDLIKNCSGRCVFLNNRLSNSKDSKPQLDLLFEEVEKMLKKGSEKPYYTYNIISKIEEEAHLRDANKHDKDKCYIPYLPQIAGGSAVIATTGIVMFGIPSLLVLPVGLGIGMGVSYYYKDSKKPIDKLSKVLEEIKEDSTIQCTIS